MKRIPIALIALLLFCTSAQAADIDTVLSGLQSYWASIDTFTARFVQKKHLTLLSGDVTSRGSFAYKRPGNMVFRYNPPEDTIMGIKPGLITLYFPSLKKARRIHLSSGADVGHWMSFGLGPIKDITALKDAAVVTVTDTNGATVITFAPKDEKEVVRKVVISLKEDYTPLGVTISEKNGDLTIMEFSDQKVNSPVDDALFDVKIPPGVVIEEIGN